MAEWMGADPVKCDMCEAPLESVFIDGMITTGPCGMLCASCHADWGCGLGAGRGQRYERRGDKWIKTGG